MTRTEHQSRPGRSSSWIRPDKRARIYARDRYRCLWCGRRPAPGEILTLDHFLSRSAGGSNEAGNLITSCHEHNAARRHEPALTFAHRKGILFNGPAETLDRILDALDRPLPVFVP